jgi:hypothetical protein
MLEYFREVETTGETLVVTRNGQPVLKVRSYCRELTVDYSNSKFEKLV